MYYKKLLNRLFKNQKQRKLKVSTSNIINKLVTGTESKTITLFYKRPVVYAADNGGGGCGDLAHLGCERPLTQERLLRRVTQEYPTVHTHRLENYIHRYHHVVCSGWSPRNTLQFTHTGQALE